MRSTARVARQAARTAAARHDGIQKLTSLLATTYEIVVVEDLAVTNLTASAKGAGRSRGKAGLNRALLDVAPWELRRQLTYKCRWNGATLVVADRWFPSTKMCSECGAVKAKLALSERTYCCDRCGLSIDRDYNAARNLAALGAGIGTGSGPETGRSAAPANGRGDEGSMGNPRCSSGNRQGGASSGEPDRSVTASLEAT
ncbi:MAG: RNA-guided endonuclease InsQ/TnpB family protein [Acidimicrobiales bacterium]